MILYSTIIVVLRKMYFRNVKHAHAKLVRAARDAALDVAVNLRKGAPAYKKWGQ